MTSIGFTGTREGMTDRQKQAFELIARPHSGVWHTFNHGDCVGADEDAAEIAHVYAMHVVSYPPINPKSRSTKTKNNITMPEKEYLERDRDIVDNSDILIAAPKSLTPEHRSGTWYTINYAKSQGKPIIILHP